MTVWKYQLNTYTGETTLQLPAGATPLRVDDVDDEHLLWVLLDASKPLETRTFVVFGTGAFIPDGHKYINTFFSDGREFHAFERIEQ